MTAPLCPFCSEPMSNSEHRLGGVWSCLYCERVWLPRMQSAALGTAERIDGTCAVRCPDDESPLFMERHAAGWAWRRCPACAGALVEAGVVREAAPQLLRPVLGDDSPARRLLRTWAGDGILLTLLAMLFPGGR